MTWQEQAACRGADSRLWLPELRSRMGPNRERPEQLKRALTVCGRCPVRADCLAMALSEGLVEGVFGGKTAEQRAVILNRRYHGGS